MRRILSLSLVVALALFTAAPLTGQSVPDAQKAEVAVEIQLGRLRQSPLYDALKSNLERMRDQSNLPDDVNLDDIDSVFFAVALPESVEDFQAMESVGQGGALPMEFYARMTFVESAAVEAMMSKAREGSIEREINGKTYYAPTESENAPSNVLAHQLDDRTVEVGTVDYLTTGTGDHLLTGGLATAWSKMPEATIRIAVDLDHASALIEQAVALAREQADPMAVGFIRLITKATDLRLAIDATGPNLVALATTGKDEKASVELQAGLSTLLGMAKFGGQQAVQTMEQEDPDSAKVVKALLESLTAEQDGAEVTVTIPKPEGFDAFVEKMLEMGGMGGGF